MLLISTLDAAEGEINITMRNLERDVEVGINWTNTWRAKHFICCLLYGFSLFNPVLTGRFWCITPGLLIVTSCLSLDWTTRGISSAQLSVRLFHKAVAVSFSSWLLSSTSSSVSSPLSPTQLWFWTESLPLFLLEVSYRRSAGWTSNWANELLAATAVNQETWGRAARGHQKYFLSNIWTVGAVWFGSRPTSSPNLHRAGTVPLITSQTTMKMLLKLLL